MATLMPEGKQSFRDNAGLPFVGGKVWTYDAGTSTPRPTYQDAAGTVPNTNPIILDARGESTVFWNGAYKVVLMDDLDSIIWTVDGVVSANSTADESAQEAIDSLLLASGAGKVGKSGGGTVQNHIDDVGTHIAQSVVGDSGYKSRVLSGVLRQDTAGSGWYFIDDTGHKPNGFASVAVNGTGEIVVTYDFTAVDVGSLLVGPDEVYANLGIAAGASVGDASSTIHLFQSLYGTVNLSTLALASNPYFSGTLSAVLNADGTVTVTHPSCGSASVGAVGGDTQGYDVKVQSYTATTVTFASWVDFTGYIEYNGSTWTVSTAAKQIPTMVFSGGVLTVTHETLPTQDATVTVDGRDITSGTTTVHVRPGSSTPTTFEAIFRDNAGVLIGAPSTAMKFYYSSAAKVKRAVPLGTINFTRPGCKLDANNVFSGSGNLWLLGVMKVA